MQGFKLLVHAIPRLCNRFILIGLALLSSTVLAQPTLELNEIQKLLDGEDEIIRQLGWSVSVDGDTALVGAGGDGDLADGDPTYNSGSVYVFVNNMGTWSLLQKLLAPDGASNDRFGVSVALNGNTAVVGAQGDDGNQGSAYVFTRSSSSSTFSYVQKLTASDAVANDKFGTSVAIDGDTAAVGQVPGGRRAGAGSVYVFTRSGSTWSQVQKLTANDGIARNGFGGVTALEGDTLVVGALNDDDNGGASGSAYVYTRNMGTWSFQEKLVAPDGAANATFGQSLALDGDTLAVSGPRADNTTGSQSGSVYVFVNSIGIWSLQQKLIASDGVANNQFGSSVALDGDTLVASAAFAGGEESRSGSAYVFTRTANSWNEKYKLLASDGKSDDLFGVAQAVDVSDGQIFVGAPGRDDEGDRSGAAYIFDIFGPQDPPLTQDFNYRGICETNCDSVGLMEGDSVTGIIGLDLSAVVPSNVLEVSDVLEFDFQFGTRGFQSLQTPKDGVVLANGVVQIDGTGNGITGTGRIQFREGGPSGPLYGFIDASDSSWLAAWPNLPSSRGSGTFLRCPAPGGPPPSDVDEDGVPDTCDFCPSDPEDNCETNGSAAEELTPDLGGEVSTPDGQFVLTVDAGDLAEDETLSVTEIVDDQVLADVVVSGGAEVQPLALYVLEPDGTQFNNTVTLSINLDVTALTQEERDNLDIYLHEDTTGDSVPDTFVGQNANCFVLEDPIGVFTASCNLQLLHFSTYAVLAPKDSDEDGIFDDFDGIVDACPTSDRRSTVAINSCNSGVVNHLAFNGCTIMDEIDQCPMDSQGDFSMCISHLTNDMKKSGLISGKEKGRIQKCAKPPKEEKSKSKKEKKSKKKKK